MDNALLLMKPGLEPLQHKTNQEPYARFWRHLVTRWEGVAARVAKEGKPFDQGGLAWHGITPMVVEAAVIYRLTKREDALAYVLMCIQFLLDTYGECPDPAVLEASARATKIHTQRPKVLSHGEVAMAADILGEDLPANIQTTLADLMRKTCIPFHKFDTGLTGYSSGGNVVLCRNLNAAICALTWGKASGFDGWETVVDNACDNVRQYLRNGCDADGFSYEGTGYGLGVMEFIFLFCHLLSCAQWHDDLLKSEPRLRRMPDVYQHMLLPDGRTAMTNDAGYGPYGIWWLLLAAAEWDRPDYRGVWEHIAGPDHPVIPWGDRWPAGQIQGAEKTMLMTFLYWDANAPVQPIAHSPLPTAVCAEGSGTATFRTGWHGNALYAAMLGGGRSRACFGHAHADCGHINIAVGDEYLAIDPGRYNWPEDQHSVVLVDGHNADPLPAGTGMGGDPSFGHLGQFQRHRMLDYAVADAAAMKTAAWALRHFLFIRTGQDDGYIVLLDNINKDYGKAPHQYMWQLQCAMHTRIEIDQNLQAATVHGSNARIDCAFFQKPEPPVPDCPHTLSVKQDIKEWVWPYGKEQDPKILAALQKTHRWTTSIRRPRLLATQTTLSCMLVSVLSPCRVDQPSRTVRQIPVTNGIGLEVQTEGLSDMILIAPDHKLILTDTVKSFSEFAVIRRDESGRLLDTWTQSGEPLRFLRSLCIKHSPISKKRRVRQ